MAEFTKATKDLILTVVIGGESKEITIPKDKYYKLAKGTPVLKHDALCSIAQENGVYVSKTTLEYGAYNAKDNYCFIFRSFGVIPGLHGEVIEVDEVGEANPLNLSSEIGSSYPAVMANKRAQDRLLIRLLGLQGSVYSDSEFDSVSAKPAPKEELKTDKSKSAKTTVEKPEKEMAKEETAKEVVENEGIDEERPLSIEEIKALPVKFGRYKTKPITLGELKEKDLSTFEWIVNTYQPAASSSADMKALKKGAILLKEAS